MTEPKQYIQDVEVKHENGKLKIFILGLIHVVIDENESPIVAFQSYYWPNKKRYHIDYQFKNGKYHETWYHDRETWEEILQQLERIFK